MLKTLLAAGVAALALSAAAPAMAATTQNLIVNGTFDNNTTGWTGVYQTRSADPVTDTGPYFFPGPGAFHMIYQDYTLTGDQLTSLADAGLGFTLSADLFGWRTQQDRGTLSVFFKDADDNRIGSATLSSSTLYDGLWDSQIEAGGKYFQSLSGFVPLETTSLSFIITSTRIGGGTNNDGYIDNAAFTFTDLAQPAPVPLPAALPLLGAGLLALGVVGRRSRKAATA
jgi:opacity protein-like surface antigen